jgi:hypothetical protein
MTTSSNIPLDTNNLVSEAETAFILAIQAHLNNAFLPEGFVLPPALFPDSFKAAFLAFAKELDKQLVERTVLVHA